MYANFQICVSKYFVGLGKFIVISSNVFPFFLLSFSEYFLHIIDLLLYPIFYVFIWVSQGLPCYALAFSSCGKWELLFAAMCRLLILVTFLVVEHRL